MAVAAGGLNELHEFCQAFNVRRESENDAARMWVVLILDGVKDRNAPLIFGVSLNKTRASENNGVPSHLFITNKLAGLTQIDRAASSMLKALKESVAANRLSKLPWHTQGETRMSKKRWNGPYKNNEKG